MTRLNGFCMRILAAMAVAAITLSCGATPADPPATGAEAVAAAKAKPHLLTPAERAAMRRVVSSNGPVQTPESGPSPVIVDIGEGCLEYRYSEEAHCPSDVQLSNCQAATSAVDCGITAPFTLTNTWCQQVDTHELQKWHVFCQGYTPSGPLPTPQCPDGHVWGDSGQNCISSCTKNCAKICVGGYCTDGAYNLCYDQYQPECDCGVAQCPCTGPDC